MPYAEFYEVAGQIVRREVTVKEEEETSQLPTLQEEKKKIVQKVHPVLSVPTLEDEERTHFNVPTTSSSLSSQSKEGKKTEEEEELHLK
jgi:argininosuccinate lyase